MKTAKHILLLSFILIACDQLKEDNQIGPCVHTYEDPVLHIKSVKNRNTGTDISKIQIHSLKKDGSPINIDSTSSVYLIQASNGYNVTIRDSTLVCSIPCGFGFDEGSYQFVVATDGYRDTIISVNAKYAVSKGGCPSSNSGGSQINIQLQPQ